MTHHTINSSDAPWRTGGELPPYKLAARELAMMARVIERDWTQDDTTPAQDAALVRVADMLRNAARELVAALDHERTPSATRPPRTVLETLRQRLHDAIELAFYDDPRFRYLDDQELALLDLVLTKLLVQEHINRPARRPRLTLVKE